MAFYRAREPRVPVDIAARLKSDVGWGDSQILNVSAHGMMVKFAPPPPIGSYVEVCKGQFSIVGRVRWIGNDHFGLQALEKIDLDDIQRPRPRPKARTEERRRRPRIKEDLARRRAEADENHAASRRLGSLFEFATIGLIGLASGWVIVEILFDTLSAPLSVVEAALAQ